jgi:hypothetical protein
MHAKGGYMSINPRRVITGGLVAGVVIILFNILAQFVLADRVKQEMNNWIPASADRMSMGVGVIAAGLMMKFVVGIILIWVYAAIRPRFGPGPQTAAYVAIAVWILGAVFFSDLPLMGMMSITTYILLETLQLVTFLIASLVGAKMYSEHSVPNTTNASALTSGCT